MSFDARSLERLKELGRTLPKPLPKPEAPPPAPKASEQRHKVETETNPEALFRELMQASPDGTVPPHLLDRLRQLEGGRTARRRPTSGPARAAAAEAAITLGDGEPAEFPAAPASRAPRKASPSGRTTAPSGRRARSSEEESLYTAFQQLLLEDDDS